MAIKRGKVKSQTAIEYLITYGWVIIVIAVILGGLIALGVFNPSSYVTSNTCIITPDFNCNTAILSENGILFLNLQQATSSPINITSIACSTNSSTNTVTRVSPQVYLGSGENHTFELPCYSNGYQFSGHLGDIYHGYIIVNYTNVEYDIQHISVGTLILKVQVALPVTTTTTITTTTSTSSTSTSTTSTTSTSTTSSIPPSVTYVPITLSNAQGVPTPAPFQQMISFDPSSYSSYESADLGNIRFFSGVNELHSWCESGCTNSSSSAIFWVNLPAGVPASSNTALSMGFESVGTNYDGVFAGEAPQLSPTYGEYDNGASVFSFYDNFAGTHISGAWDTAGGAYSVDNGLIITPANLVGESFSLNSKYTAPLVIDTLQYFTTTGSPNYLGISFTNMTSTTYDYSSGYYTQIEGGKQLLCSTGGAPATCGSPSDTANPNQYTEQVTTLEVNGAKSAAALQNYGNMVVNNNPTSSASEYPGYMGYATTGQTILSYWFRIRAYPPNGVMPTVTLG